MAAVLEVFKWEPADAGSRITRITDAVMALLPARPSPTDDARLTDLHDALAEIERLREQNTALGVRIQQGWAEIERFRAPSLHGHVTDAEDFGSEHGDYTALTIHIPGAGHHQLVDHHVAVVDEGDAMDHPDWGHDPDDQPRAHQGTA
jgi:hypothetical protein